MKPINFSTSPAVFWWKPAAWLRVSGADAATFLQGQFTNDLRGLAEGETVYGLWLSVKGKVVADSFVLGDANTGTFWIGSYFSPAEIIVERLTSHIIADEVILDDMTASWTAASLFGIEANSAFLKSWGGIEFRGRRSRENTIEWAVPTDAADEMRSRVRAIRQLSEEEVARLRIESGIPSVPVDIGPRDLPNEGGLDAAAVSYTKGCYLGQEVMARLKSMGQVRRRLLRVAGSAEKLAALPAPLFAGARLAGELRSIARDGQGGFLGLAMISLMHVEADSVLSFAPDSAPVVHLLETP